jgi:hypothetical protein
MKELIELSLVLSVIGIFGLIITTAFSFNSKRTCNNYSEIKGLETKYRHFDGCYININSEWLTQAEYSQIIIAREGLKATK